MIKRSRRSLLTAAIITAASVAVVILALRRPAPPTSLQFLQARKPLQYDRFNRFTITIYSFEADVDEVCSQASAELASLGFKKTPNIPGPVGEYRFEKRGGKSRLLIAILGARLLDETTSADYVYEDAPDWVSVEITGGRERWHHYLSRVSKGLIPPPRRDPPIRRTRISHGAIPSTTVGQPPRYGSSIPSKTGAGVAADAKK